MRSIEPKAEDIIASVLTCTLLCVQDVGRICDFDASTVTYMLP